MTRTFERLRRATLETLVAVIIAVLGGIAFGGLDRLFTADTDHAGRVATASSSVSYTSD